MLPILGDPRGDPCRPWKATAAGTCAGGAAVAVLPVRPLMAASLVIGGLVQLEVAAADASKFATADCAADCRVAPRDTRHDDDDPVARLVFTGEVLL